MSDKISQVRPSIADPAGAMINMAGYREGVAHGVGNS